MLPKSSGVKDLKRKATLSSAFSISSCDSSSGQSSLTTFFATTQNRSRKRARTTPSSFSRMITPQTSKAPSSREPETPVSPKSSRTQVQMYLDLGQTNWGKRVTCNICGMYYEPNLAEDLQNHAAVCQDYSRGVFFPKAMRKRVIATGIAENDEIIEARPGDSVAIRERSLAAQRIVNQELGFYFSAEDQESSRSNEDHSNTYIYIRDNRAIGLVVAERIEKAHELLDKVAGQNERDPVKSRPAVLGIRILWVHADHRHQGIASLLVQSARERFVFGWVVPINQIAFSSPTPAGAAFARCFVREQARQQTSPVLVYDECFR